MTRAPGLERIISGGQSGVDRAALDAAIAAGIAYGGWCPRDGWAEDKPDPPGLLACYPLLRATGSADPAARTRLNARDSDATVVLSLPGVDSPGTELARSAAHALGRPVLALDLLVPALACEQLGGLLGRLDGPVALHVAGPRESEAPGVYARARALLDAALSGAG